jgi:hypothetical protein
MYNHRLPMLLAFCNSKRIAPYLLVATFNPSQSKL